MRGCIFLPWYILLAGRCLDLPPQCISGGRVETPLCLLLSCLVHIFAGWVVFCRQAGSKLAVMVSDMSWYSSLLVWVIILVIVQTMGVCVCVFAVMPICSELEASIA